MAKVIIEKDIEEIDIIKPGDIVIFIGTIKIGYVLNFSGGLNKKIKVALLNPSSHNHDCLHCEWEVESVKLYKGKIILSNE